MVAYLVERASSQKFHSYNYILRIYISYSIISIK
nr:MAG TPA: hypothetical protein [Bacteriophage sp.]